MFICRFYKEEESEGESEEEESSLGSSEGLGLESDSENEEKKVSKSNDVKKNENPLLTDLDYRAKKEKRLSKVALWFQKENLQNLETEIDEDYDLDILSQNLKNRGKKIVGENKENNIPKKEKKNLKSNEKLNECSDSESDSDDSDSDSDELEKGKKRKRSKHNEGERNGLDETSKKEKKKKKLDEEGLAVGAVMVSSKKKKRDLIDGAWNRYAFNDENLPDWFVQDEKQNMTHKMPVPVEMVKEYKNKLQELNVRPIKKIVEAKARKKRRMIKALQKSKKKMENIMENADLSQKEKVRNIQK